MPLLLLPLAADASLPPVKDPASNIGFLTNKEVDKKRKRCVCVSSSMTAACQALRLDTSHPALLLLFLLHAHTAKQGQLCAGIRWPCLVAKPAHQGLD